ncbi:MAG: hypothetical protein WCD72_06645 [Dehalococcoidia bacterium]
MGGRAEGRKATLFIGQLDLYKKFTKDTILAAIANAALGLGGLVLIPIHSTKFMWD